MSDVNLGKVDGIRLAAMMCAAKPLVRVVIVSGLPEHIERARKAGFTHCLGKPFALAALKRAVE